MSFRVPPRVRDLPAPSFQAVLWDFDGTLVDTEPVWQEAEKEIAAELGGTLPRDFAHTVVGLSLLDSAAVLLAAVGRDDVTPRHVVDRMVEIMVDRLRTEPVPWRPGAEALLGELNAAGVPTALVSASWRGILDAIVERLPEGSFHAIVAGDDVEHGKPAPDPYLRAADMLGVDPTRCVAMEDSVPGVRSATAAGAYVVVCPNVVVPPVEPGQLRVDSLADLDLAALRKAWESRDRS